MRTTSGVFQHWTAIVEPTEVLESNGVDQITSASVFIFDDINGFSVNRNGE